MSLFGKKNIQVFVINQISHISSEKVIWAWLLCLTKKDMCFNSAYHVISAENNWILHFSQRLLTNLSLASQGSQSWARTQTSSMGQVPCPSPWHNVWLNELPSYFCRQCTADNTLNILGKLFNVNIYCLLPLGHLHRPWVLLPPVTGNTLLIVQLWNMSHRRFRWQYSSIFITIFSI